ncbi:protein FAM228B-like isoform X1 [Lissotriton helveticus]
MEKREESHRKTSPAISTRSHQDTGEGSITLHCKEGHADSILADLLPVPKESSEVETSVVPKKIRSCSSLECIPYPCLKRKPLDAWLTQKHTQALAEKENSEVSSAIQCVLNRETIYGKEFDKFLRNQEIQTLRKKEIQHKKWLERVSIPLLRTIDNYIDQQTYNEIVNRRQKQFAQYLEYCNKKGYVFLEDYDPSEYNPFFLYLWKSYLKVSTPPLHDPLLRQLHDKFEEEGIVLHCETGRAFTAKDIEALHKRKLPLVPFGRKIAGGPEWLKTPLGFIESEVRLRSRQKMMGRFNISSLDPNFKEDQRPALDRYMSVGFKRRFPERTPTTKQAPTHKGAKLIAV